MPRERKLSGVDWLRKPVFGDTNAYADASRSLEGLNQNDKIIALLSEQTALLRYIAEVLHRRESGGPQ